MNVRVTAAAAILAAAIAAPACADNFTDQMDKARAAYDKHDLGGAQKALGTAETLLREQRLVQWKAVLPDAADGWKAENVEGTAAAMAILGGGVSVSRRYRKDGTSVTIELIADSPIVTSVAGMFKMFAAMGAETFVVGNQTAVYRKDDHSVTAIVADKALVTVKGQNAAEDDLKAYFKSIKLAEIEKLVK
jgi:hypothetical protein